eukprot:1461379-Amphidinium_carterae.1
MCAEGGTPWEGCLEAGSTHQGALMMTLQKLSPESLAHRLSDSCTGALLVTCAQVQARSAHVW